MALTKNERRLRIKSRISKVFQVMKQDQDFVFLEVIRRFMRKLLTT